MQLSDPLGISIGTAGIIIANILLYSVRRFAWRTGLQVSWLSRSLGPERRHLKRLLSSEDKTTARRARLYLSIEILGWTTAILSILLFFWGMLSR